MADLETADDLTVQCNYCGEPFEIEDDYDEDNHPTQHVIVPVECDKGCFCSEAHRVQAMYEAQDEAGRRALRRYYLGAQLLSEYKPSEGITKGWDLDWDEGDPAAILCALSPEGGIGGKEGIEDDCDALLMPESVRSTLRVALKRGIRAASCALEFIETMSTGFLWKDYVNSVISHHRKELAEAEAALKALEGLKGVMG